MIARSLALALAVSLPFTSPFRAEDPRAREGHARLEAGAPDDALRLYGEAERAEGPRPELDFARGHALLAAGEHAAALAAFGRAAERADPALASRALQNAGTLLARGGDLEAAARAFAEALSRDPSNDDARWNLEVVLRRRAAGEPPRAPSPQAGSGRAAAEATGDGAPDVRPASAEPRDGRAGRDAPAQAAPAGERRAPMSRREAQALLDALRARERNAPFAARGAGRERRADGAKDW